MPNYSAEDLPAYMFDTDRRRRPMTDEDAAMSAPSHIARQTTEEGARAALVGHLERISKFGFVVSNGSAALYLAAAREIAEGKHAVQVFGRVFRVRDLDLCPRKDLYHGPCEVCTPETWTVYDNRKKGQS